VLCSYKEVALPSKEIRDKLQDTFQDLSTLYSKGQAVTLLFDAVCYKAEGRGFEF
jgi:hypothetical protein